MTTNPREPTLESRHNEAIPLRPTLMDHALQTIGRPPKIRPGFLNKVLETGGADKLFIAHSDQHLPRHFLP